MEPFTFANILKQDASYETFFAGKYLNEYRGTMVPPGWDHFYGLQGNSAYYDYKLNVNGQVKSFGNDSESYLTKVIVSNSPESSGNCKICSVQGFQCSFNTNLALSKASKHILK